MSDASLEQELESRVEALGYELVELERAGSKARPIFRIRIDVPAAAEARGVTVEDCTRVSRALEPWIEERGDVAERYVLEVSSPGVERPLVKPRDFRRFAGKEVSLRGKEPLAGRGKRLDGELLGIEGEGADERVRLRLKGGDIVEVPRAQITRAQLIFRWDDRAG